MDAMVSPDTSSQYTSDGYPRSAEDADDGMLTPSGIQKIQAFIASNNIAVDLDPGQLSTIGTQAVNGYEHDYDSLNDWREMAKRILKLAKLEKEEKSYPWEGASNIKYPLITQAAIQFAARAYPEIVQGTKVVKAQVIGDDPEGLKQDKADRISEHMSWQLLEHIDCWEECTDKLLNMLPIYGTVYRKVWYDPITAKPAVALMTPFELIMNANVRTMDEARRVSQVFFLSSNDVRERVNAGIWLDEPLGNATYMGMVDGEEARQGNQDDDASLYMFIEQHRWIDLDEDGYEEPYIVTVHKDTNRVMRIVARYDEHGVEVENGKLIRIEPTQYFVKYSFIPSPDGKGIDVGLGALLNAVNESINSIMNQLIDSGTLANLQGGFVSSSANVNGVAPVSPGQWIKADVSPEDLAKAFFLIPTKEPSGTLFQLLNFAVASAKELASNVDVLSGGAAGANTSPTTMLAQIEQGQKVYSSIYKRIYRSLRREFKLLAAINAKYLSTQQYFRVLGSQVAMQVGAQDYAAGEFDVIPIADPQQSTAIQRLAKAQALYSMKDMVGLNQYELTKEVTGAMQIHNQQIMIPEDKLPPPPPDPIMEDVKVTEKLGLLNIQLQKAKLMVEMEKVRGGVEKALADATLALAQAEQTGANTDLAKLEAQVNTIKASFDMHMQAIDQIKELMSAAQTGTDGIGGIQGVVQRTFIPKAGSQSAHRAPDMRGFGM